MPELKEEVDWGVLWYFHQVIFIPDLASLALTELPSLRMSMELSLLVLLTEMATYITTVAGALKWIW